MPLKVVLTFHLGINGQKQKQQQQAKTTKVMDSYPTQLRNTSNSIEPNVGRRLGTKV